MGENIGAAARAMANFGLSRLRLVAPRDGWPNERASAMAAGADWVLDAVTVYVTLEEALHGVHYAVATSARPHGQIKPVVTPRQAVPALLAHARSHGDAGVALLFGAERSGLSNDEVALADAVLTVPVNPAFASLNLAQSVGLLSYLWFEATYGDALPYALPDVPPLADKQELMTLITWFLDELERVQFFRPAAKMPRMKRNMRNILNRLALNAQDVKTLFGALRALTRGRDTEPPAQVSVNPDDR
jgi:tRNA/rRNA methyltransferase